MKNIIAYDSVYFFDREYSHFYNNISQMPDVRLFGGMFYLYARNMSVVDRTGTIKIPLNVSVLPNCRMPEYRQVGKTFEQICNERAISLMRHAKTSGRKIATMWSGGVDSTLILTSFLKNCDINDIRNHMVVLMSPDSITENPRFYDSHVLPNFDLMPSNNFAHIIGNDKYLYLTGEGNDQLFASLFVIDSFKDFWNGSYTQYDKMTEENMIPFIQHRTKFNEADALKLYRLSLKICDAAPFKISTPFQFFWWNNLVLKWQNVYVRSMLFANPANRAGIKLEENYTTFFHNDDFQLWSMNTVERTGRLSTDDSNRSYKEVCKDIIFNFDGNNDYRLNKNKYGSFNKVIMSKHASNFVTEDMVFHSEMDFMEAYNKDNDFF